VTKFIHKYLSAHFIIKLDEIVLKDNDKVYYAEDLIEELFGVFGLTKKQLKPYIKDWTLKHNNNFDFKKFWLTTNPYSGLVLPRIRRVYPRMITQDLVVVKPNRNSIIYNLDILNQATQNTLIGELNHLEGSAVARFMNEWAGLAQNQTIRDNLNQLYRNQLTHLQRPI
jgi:hypothetical protein